MISKGLQLYGINKMSTKHQHTIPQFYLKPFLTPGLVYRGGKSAPQAVGNPKKVAVKRNYYGKASEQRIAIDHLNVFTEDKGAPILRKLIHNPKNITDSDWFILSYLLANFAIRTPAAVEEFRSTQLVAAAQINEMAERMIVKINEALSEGKDMSLLVNPSSPDGSHSFTLDQLNKEASILGMKKGHLLAVQALFAALPSVAEYMRKMTFLILEAPSDLFFLTSDRPLYLQSRLTGSRVGAGWGKSDALGCIALCPSRFLCMFYHKDPSIHSQVAPPEEVASFNFETIKFAYEEVYSPFEYPPAYDWMRGEGYWSTKE
jgi:hypothetical protein